MQYCFYCILATTGKQVVRIVLYLSVDEITMALLCTILSLSSNRSCLQCVNIYMYSELLCSDLYLLIH
jgi:hypothetical protein